MGFEVGEVFRVSPVFGLCFYFPVNIYSCKQRNKCNQTVPTKKSQDLPRPMLWNSIDLTKKSAATRSLNNIIPVLYSLDFETHFEASKSHLVKSLAHYQFQNRRNLISEYCQLNQNSSELHQVNQDLKWNKDLWFDYKNQLLFCQISKISSSTWVTNLMA